MNVDDLVIEDVIFEPEIHIRVVKRNNRKCITSVEGMNDYGVDLKKVIKEWKKTLSCNGAVKNDVITLQGDHREEIKKFCIDELEIKKDNIKVHGF